ncbi:MAG: SMP-30/gluconolactonase/LRE family protein [Planctomycetes bacterium]|nr:SMP-30/gluconolactonase/LRE family protein [Planctomycetota bacterium]
MTVRIQARLRTATILTCIVALCLPAAAQEKQKGKGKSRQADTATAEPIWLEPTRAAPFGTHYKTFASAAVGQEVSYLLYLPPEYEASPERRFPVLYWLHGGGGNQVRSAGFIERLDPAIRAGKAPAMIVVLVNGLPGSLYCDSQDGRRPVETMIVKDLIPHIDQTCRTIARREGRGVEGFSMGGTATKTCTTSLETTALRFSRPRSLKWTDDAGDRCERRGRRPFRVDACISPVGLLHCGRLHLLLFRSTKMRMLWILCSLLVVPALGATIVTAAEPIVPPDAKLELLYTRTAPISGGLTEGPAVAPDGSIYFTDIPEGADQGLIVRFDPKTRATSIFAADSHKANGLIFDAQGRLVACEGASYGGRCLSRWNVQTSQREVLADRYQGKRFNAPNDLCIDLRGRIYFSDPRYLGHEPRELEHRAVYRIDTDGSVREITHDIEKPNGIAISPDQRTLYVADTNNGTDQIDPNAPPPAKGAMKVYAFPLSADGLVSGPARTLIDFGNDNGCDGMTLDVQGNLYLAARTLARPGILILDPQGKELGYLSTGPSQPGAKQPVGLPSNCDFGIGDERSTLYLTVDKSLYRVRLNAEGYHIPWAR